MTGHRQYNLRVIFSPARALRAHRYEGVFAAPQPVTMSKDRYTRTVAVVTLLEHLDGDTVAGTGPVLEQGVLVASLTSCIHEPEELHG